MAVEVMGVMEAQISFMLCCQLFMFLDLAKLISQITREQPVAVKATLNQHNAYRT